MQWSQVAGVARAQRIAREVVHEVAATVAPGDRECDVAQRMDDRLERAGVQAYLHTGYAWWGGRTRFSRFVDWEPDALPTERRLEEGEPFILDVAPIVDGHPADYAYSGVAGAGAPSSLHEELKRVLARLKERIVSLARTAATGAELYRAVAAEIVSEGVDAVHPRYPGGVLGHALPDAPIGWPLARAPRLGRGFQLPILGLYGLALGRHKLFGGPYPFVDARSGDAPRGLWAIEPHVARAGVGAKFESILLIDGGETRWLDPDLFGEVKA